jgi:hypothetical protein
VQTDRRTASIVNQPGVILTDNVSRIQRSKLTAQNVIRQQKHKRRDAAACTEAVHPTRRTAFQKLHGEAFREYSKIDRTRGINEVQCTHRW